MTIQVIIATYNRSQLLAKTLDSLLAAVIPEGMALIVTVVDNNSSDNTRDLVDHYKLQFNGKLFYIFEPHQGKTWALNTAIASCDSDLVGMIDDDERIRPDWLQVAQDAFRRPEVDYVGGTTFPYFTMPQPDWLPERYAAVIGQIGDLTATEVREFGVQHHGMPAGGNLIIRRASLRRLGPSPYPTKLGRKGKGMLTTDGYFYDRLKHFHLRGFLYPSLVVYHAVQPYMLTKRYFRKWVYYNEASYAMHERPSGIPCICGVPRWYYRLALASAIKFIPASLRRDPSAAFSYELDCLRFAGYGYGRWVLSRRNTSRLDSEINNPSNESDQSRHDA
jgi:glucosyl-dolichyl phosphate glucuronosyltransferase